MDKNVGKRTIINNMIMRLGGRIWDGVDLSTYDTNGILLKMPTMIDKTRAAKEAKLNLLTYFINHCSDDFLVLFEDDVILHHNFYNYFDQIIHFAEHNKFKLIYMGASCRIDKVHTIFDTQNLAIMKLPIMKYRISGAYGIIIHKSIMQTMIRHSNDPFLYKKPFDIYTLGHIQMRYPEECFICEPQIVIPNITISDIRGPRMQNNFWECCNIDKYNYLLNPSLPMYILMDMNEKKIQQFLMLISMFIPYIRPIFVYSNNEKNLNKTLLSRICCDAYELSGVSDFSEENINQIINYEKYALTNIYVNWTNRIGNIFTSDHNTKYNISLCPRCSAFNIKQNNQIDFRILNDLLIITNASQNVETVSNENLFYSINCQTDMEGNMHCVQ